MIKLENVVDIRTNQFHSVAWVKPENVKYFEGGEPQANEILEKASAFDILMGESNE